ncbi:MAG: esterase [Paenibacillaceae bacterium]|jgi:predicted alpha/beta superfamily hydrolase|nr:esterase [Paenibacillaceae bacterium]
MKGSLIKDTFEDKEITVYIPPSCGAWNITFPLLFVQDGEYLFETHTELLEQMFANGSLPEMIIAGVKPRNRLDEYTPWPAKALADIHPDFGGQGEAYIRFLAERLRPYLASNYYADESGGSTGILGASLGGLISLYAACTRPDIFSRIGLLSVSLWYEGAMDFLRKEAGKLADGASRFYLSIGTMEGSGKQTAQKDMVPLAWEARAILQGAGLGVEHLRFEQVEGGTHEHSWFVSQFPQAVQWLFGDEDDGKGKVSARRGGSGWRESGKCP